MNMSPNARAAFTPFQLTVNWAVLLCLLSVFAWAAPALAIDNPASVFVPTFPTTTTSTSASRTQPAEEDDDTTSSTTATSSTGSSSSVGSAANAMAADSVRLKPGDTVYLDIKADESLAEADKPQLPKDKIYTITADGVLKLPLVGNIPLAGLTEEEAKIRLSAEPLLQTTTMDLRVLPLETIGSGALELFGNNLFSDKAISPTDETSIPIPDNYILGAGDTVVINLYGKENTTYELVVGRDGVIHFPEIGPILANGQSFAEFSSNLNEQITSKIIGVKAHITLGALRTITVYLVGEVNNPGSYPVSSLSTVTKVLFENGGLNSGGSLRNIQVKRNGELLARLDLYQLLLRGDDTNNLRLQSGDVILVPPVGPTVSVSGEVKRPAIYELSGETHISDVLQLAGGVTPTAYLKEVQVERVNSAGEHSLSDYDLTSSSGKGFVVKSGDVITVPKSLALVDNGIILEGHVKRAGAYQWKPGMRIADLIRSEQSLLPKADLDYVLIRRETGAERSVVVFSTRLREALLDKFSTQNVVLQPKDRVMVFSFESDGDRQARISKLISEIDQQASRATPSMWVTVEGSVREAGVYPLESGMKVSDLIRASGKLKEQADPVRAEITRYSYKGEEHKVDYIQVDLAAILRGDTTQDLLLQPRDYLTVKQIPNWIDQPTVELVGEVRYPGSYPIAKGESLASVLSRAGGLTQLAAPEAAIFTREDLKEKEAARLTQMADRLETELRTTLLEKVENVQRPSDALAIANELLTKMRETTPVGRLVIDLPALLDKDGSVAKGNNEYDIILESGDKIYIPQYKQEVTVAGEVFQPTSHVYYKNLDVNDYIAASGGFTVKADKRKTYVIHSDGSVSGEATSFFSRSSSYSRSGRSSRSEVSAGDAIVVPLDVEKVPSLTFWKDISSILFNLSLSAASIDDIVNDNGGR